MRRLALKKQRTARVRINPVGETDLRVSGDAGGYLAAETSYNFDLSRGDMRPTEGFSLCPKYAAVPRGAVKFYFYKRSDKIRGSDDRLLFYSAADGFIYELKESAAVKINGLSYTEPPVGVCYNYNGTDVVIFSSSKGEMKIYDGSLVTAVDDAPAVTSMCVHYERLFITGGDDGSLWFSDDFDPTNWNLSVSEAGFIDMSDGRGATLKAVSFLNYLYVFRTYGITRVTAYADQSEFSAVNLYTSSGRIVPDSITVCGDVILFLASDGMYRFDGITTTRISGAFEDAIDFTATAKGCYYNGKAYFILSADLGDGYEKTVLRVDPETRSHCFLRGGEIDDLCLLDGGSDYSLAAYSSARRAVAEISDDPRFFGEYPTRVWKSKYSGFGLPVKNKRLSALTLYCDEPTGVTVYADGREYKYAASGNGGYAYLRPNVRGDRFAVKITAGGKVSRVSDLTLTFKYFL